MSHDTSSTGKRVVSSPFTGAAPPAPVWKWLGDSPVPACHSARTTGYVPSQKSFVVSTPRLIEKAAEYLDRTGEDRQHYWYGEYHAAHALNQVGGEQWEKYYERTKAQLLASQKPSGE